MSNAFPVLKFISFTLLSFCKYIPIRVCIYMHVTFLPLIIYSYTYTHFSLVCNKKTDMQGFYFKEIIDCSMLLEINL